MKRQDRDPLHWEEQLNIKGTFKLFGFCIAILWCIVFTGACLSSLFIPELLDLLISNKKGLAAALGVCGCTIIICWPNSSDYTYILVDDEDEEEA